jgi:uncharacterized protein (TIGR00730 family)
MSRKSICVYCGSRTGGDPAFIEAAEQFGAIFAQEDWRLVYGAGDVGLMGAVARSAQASGAETFGVIPQHLVNLEVGKTDLTAYVVTETMHERKKVMFMNCDAVVVLPGGVGSLDEFFEVLTWRQLRLHDKPVFLLNVKDYWKSLIALIDDVVAKGFADPSLLELFDVADTTPDLVERLRSLLK